MAENKQIVGVTIAPEDVAMLDQLAAQFEGNRSMGLRFVLREYRRMAELDAAMRADATEAATAPAQPAKRGA